MTAHAERSATTRVDLAARADPIDASATRAGLLYRILSRVRLTSYLLVGWCALWACWIPAASLWLPRCPYGESWCDRAPVLSGARAVTSYAVVAVVGAVALSVLWWWDRRQAHSPAVPADDPAPRRVRPAMLTAGSVIGVLAAAHLMLFAPAATLPTECTAEVHLNSAMAYCLNIDSPEFLQLAHHPRQLLRPRAVRQARPGYIALSVAATRLIGPAASRLGLDRLYGQTDNAYIPLVLFNIVTAVLSVLLLAWLLARLGTPTWATMAICAFLAVNDVMKAFIWTPHQDLFTMFVPLVTVVVAQWVIRAYPPRWRLALVGFGLGAYSLVYASVVITVVVVGIVLAARGRRGLVPAAAFGAAFAAAPLAWIAICRTVVGSYYNHEVTTYHEFIWPLMEARHGPRAVARYVEVVSIAATREFVSVAGLTLLLIVGFAAVAVRCRANLAPRSRDHRAILVASALTVAVSIAFGWGIGYQANRMMFNVVPALLVCLGWLTARLSVRSPRLRIATGTALSVVAMVVIGVTVTAPGPWS